MAAKLSIPVAQYVRMSTEHQQYSLENQSSAIRSYADAHGFEVVSTYSDSARSGIGVKYRDGLRRLLQDVVSGPTPYRVILVYDVSRWGRFQDTDESAHYEFLCKSAGVPVHYCAESFVNDGTLPSLIMKALKRTMAGEYSRELGVKVLAGQRRLASLGYWQGSRPGYGLRRMLVSQNGELKQQLAERERKNIATDRIILVPGPEHEVQVVREIYRMFMSDKRGVKAVATELNRRGIPYRSNHRWTHHIVGAILAHPKYCGVNVFGRTSRRLYTREIKVPESQWISKPGAFSPVVDPETFVEAQRILQGRTINKSNADLLDGLRGLLRSKGKITHLLIKNAPDMASSSAYRKRFGGLQQACELIGDASKHFKSIPMWRQKKALREGLLARIAEMLPRYVSIRSRGGRYRSFLRLSNGLVISVVVARSIRPWKNAVRWMVEPRAHECRLITLLARLDEENRSFLDFHVLPGIDRRKRFRLSLKDPWLKRGRHLTDLSRFCQVVEEVRSKRKSVS